MKRRDFLQSSLAALLVAQLPEMAWGAGPGADEWLVVSSSSKRGLAPTLEKAGAMIPSRLMVLGPGFSTIMEIELPFFAHSWVQSQTQPHLLLGTTKWNDEAAIVNLKTKSLEAWLTQPKNKRFFGHGLSLANGQYLVAMHNDSTKNAEMVFFEGTKEVRSFPTGHRYLHEMHFAPGQEQVVISANGNRNGAPGAIVWSDLKTGKTIKEKPVPIFLAGHLQILDQKGENILVLGLDKKPVVHLIMGDQAHTIAYEKLQNVPDKLMIETLNAAIDPRDPNSVWVAAFQAHGLMKIDLKSKTIADYIIRPEARQVFSYGGELYLSQAPRSEKVFVELQKLDKSWKTQSLKRSYGNSSHSNIIKAIKA